jgi:DNA-binding beta-propeller fold protein YncE
MRLLAFASLALAISLDAQAPGVTGTLVVTNKTPATATIIDVESGQVLATLPTGNGPHEVVISSDGATAVVTDYGAQEAGKTLTVIDVPGKKVVRTIDLGEYRRPHGIVFLPGDSLVAVTSETNRAVVTVDVRRGTVMRVAKTDQQGSHMVGVTADGRRGYTGDIGSNTVTELDMVSGAVLRRFDVPAQPEAINVTADGREVWVGSNATGKVSAIDLATGKVTTAAEGLSWPYRVLFSPDLATVMLPDYRGNTLRFVDRASKRELGRLTWPGAGPQGVTLGKDGRHLFVSLSAEGRVAIVDVAKREVIGHVGAGETPDGVAWTGRVVR